MDVASPQPWDLSPTEATQLQRELASRVVRTGTLRERDVHLIAGADVAFDRPNRRAAAAVVVLAYPSLEVVERVAVESAVTFPYVPGLLAFREIPVLLPAFEKLRSRPDLLMADGHGYAHPRRFGFACYLGLVLDVPTIGVAKSRLIGEHAPVPPHRGARVDLTKDGEVIGALLRTRDRVRPVYVSVGHRIGLADAERWVLRCARHRVPEPTRLADAVAGEAKAQMLRATIEMLVEQRAGERGRWEWEPGEGIVYRHDLDPMPAHYGCSPDIYSPGDDELLDIALVSSRVPEREEHLQVRVLDVLPKADGDDKLLAIPADEPEQPLDGMRERIRAWYLEQRKPVTDWQGEAAALALIERCRAYTAQRGGA
jgi:deoxyribonuclease V